MKIKAAILHEQNKPLIIDEIELNNKLYAGQVLVKVHTSGICGSQIGEITGAKGTDKFLPHLMGHEGCATVLDIGPGVKSVKEGDLVVLHWREGKGIQSDVPSYLWRGSKLNAGWVTTFNSHAVISENRCTKIPSKTNKNIAALFGCAITTGFGVIENNAKLKMGESVMIFGSGGIGLNMVQAAKLSSASTIIAVDIFDNRLEMAKQLGATHTVNSSRSDYKEKINQIINNNNLDIFIDNTGIPEIIEYGYKISSANARIVLVGVPRKGNKINIFSLPLHFGKTIVGSHGGETDPSKDISRYLKIGEKQLTNYANLISDEITIDQINKAITEMRNGLTAGRVIIKL